MTRDQAIAVLPSICSRIEDKGFYAAVDCYNGNAAKSKLVQHFGKSGVIELVDPYHVNTMLCKFGARLFKAYPIASRQDFMRFYQESVSIDGICGIALVSHKLKLLAFLYACYDAGNSRQDTPTLLAVGMKSAQWLCYAQGTEHNALEFYPNRLHMAYSSMQSYLKVDADAFCSFKGICFDVDDGIKDMLFCENLAVKIEIGSLNASISSIQHDIDCQTSKIRELKLKIDGINSHFEKYKDCLYESRVNADLNN